MKKKLFIPLLSALIALSGCAAARKNGGSVPTTKTDPSLDEEIATTMATETMPSEDACIHVPFTAQYIHTGSCGEATFPNVLRIESREVLEEYYQQNKDLFSLDRSHDDIPGFWEACQGYDESFFEDRCLVMVLLEEGSGSIRHEVRQVRQHADGTLTISVDTLEPEAGTCDMAQWHILLELPREYVPENPNQMMLFLDGQLAWNEFPFHPSTPLDPSRLSTPPDGTLFHSDGNVPLAKGGFNWSTTAEDGTVSTLMADALHPLQFGELLVPTEVDCDYVKLDFSEMPDSISVRCWPDTALGAETIPDGTPITTEQNTFEPLSGGYIYEITANWSENRRLDYGTATYAVYLK